MTVETGQESRCYDLWMSSASLHLACLCAAWCRLCDDYRPLLQQLETEFSSILPGLQWHWIDIEEEAELVGDLDVETFPTLVILDAEQVRFAGPLTPQAETLRRLLRATLQDVDPARVWPAVDPEIEAFAARLRLR